ncbi:hypothetical protein O0544_02390 [Edwardsiella anguillarum]|nr:hypothetical protein [Edwardsiella anguillarum]
MLVNYLMLPLIESICWEDIEKLNLPYELNEIVEQGFVELHGCFFEKTIFLL